MAREHRLVIDASSGAGGPLIIDVAGTTLTEDDRIVLREPAVGGLILFTRNFENPAQLTDLTAHIRSIRPEIVIMADYEGGRVQRFQTSFTRIPPMADLGKRYLDDPEAARQAAEEIGWLVGYELGEVGIDLPLAPVADLDYGQSSVIGDRAFSDRIDVLVFLASAYMSGLRAAGSLATAKHFPGHGWVAADSHAELPVDTRDEAALAADWQPFAALIEAGIASVMMAHVHYPAIDAAPASLSRHWIHTILRGQLGFEGLVFCDDLSMGGAVAFGDTTTRVRAALAAGCDVLPVCNDRTAAAEAIAAVNDRLSIGQDQRNVFIKKLAEAQANRGDDVTRAARARETIQALTPS